VLYRRKFHRLAFQFGGARSESPVSFHSISLPLA
jgi:hypothetical protein